MLSHTKSVGVCGGHITHLCWVNYCMGALPLQTYIFAIYKHLNVDVNLSIAFCGCDLRFAMGRVCWSVKNQSAKGL